MKAAVFVLASAAVLLLCLCAPAQGRADRKPRFKAVAFDYFVIFDANSVIPEVEKVFPGKGAEFTKAWRSKQFEYGYLRSITNAHEDFFKVTGDALDYTAEVMNLSCARIEKTTSCRYSHYYNCQLQREDASRKCGKRGDH